MAKKNARPRMEHWIMPPGSARTRDFPATALGFPATAEKRPELHENPDNDADSNRETFLPPKTAHEALQRPFECLFELPSKGRPGANVVRAAAALTEVIVCRRYTAPGRTSSSFIS